MKDWRWIVIILVFSLLFALLPGGEASAQVPPSVTTEEATDVTCSSATLNGNLTSMGNATTVYVSFEWGATPSLGNETTPQLMASTGPFSAGLNDLLDNATYYFRAKAVGDGTAYGGNLTFTTETLPSVTTNAATSVTFESAILNGNLDSLGNATSIDVSFEWGLTDSYGNETATQSLTGPGSFSATITNLSPTTTYHYRAKAADGNCTSYGSDLTFETAKYLWLEGWGWCTNSGEVVPITFEGYTTMVERAHASNSYSMHTTGNLTLPAPYNETITLDMYGSRVRSLFYLRQEITGVSARFEGTWLEGSGNETYIALSGTVALPNSEGEVFKTARICFVMLRTPDVEVPITEPGSFVEDVESMLSRFVKLVDNVLDSLIGTGFSDMLSNILSKIMVLIAHIRELGTPYIT